MRLVNNRCPRCGEWYSDLTGAKECRCDKRLEASRDRWKRRAAAYKAAATRARNERDAALALSDSPSGGAEGERDDLR